MRSLLVPFVLAAAAALPVPAHAQAPSGDGCHWVLLGTGDDIWRGVLDGGPVDAPGATVEVTCEIVDAWTQEVLATVTSGPQQDRAVAFGAVQYRETGNYSDTICTTAVVDGVEWHPDGDGWTTADVPCPYAGETLPDEQCLSLECGPIGSLDPHLCPVLAATVGDEQGDVEGVWDCPPYEVS